MPNSLVLLDIQPEGVAAELQLPLSELQLSFGNNIAKNPESLVTRLGPQLKAYLLQHIHPISADNRPWKVEVRDMLVQPVEESASGPYQELTVHLWLSPPAGANSRTFKLNYDVIIHQVVTHTALVSIRQDWETGVLAEQPVEVGVIRLDIVNNKILPLEINQKGGGVWNGFKSMVQLGIRHISEGTDHLLFLLVLLLPAPLLVAGNRWSSFGGVKYSIKHLLKVVTAFTIGHSLTLLAGALGWLRLPGQPVEILIAFSILVSAVHAFRPLFPGKEAFVAAGFGLIHGLAFAGTLSNLNLEPTYMALSILGFNIGIELMQLFVVSLMMPWLILLSRTSFYPIIRNAGALFAAVAALAWIAERISEKSNPVTGLVEEGAAFSRYILAVLALVALVGFWWERNKKQTTV
ncbi:MAG: hypothetical protein COW65_06245 [Cytophagales bacterium CG18_big_fil_WC_8_21_14_2_50_42_9]|nr:MAG: hypothetical protein COW65_06245 [Cytophagales bacterium CG18_big_fil_WC_8_21_14_2_50_42_9]